MSRTIVIVPKAERSAAQTITDNRSVVFGPHEWYHGVPSDDEIDWGHAATYGATRRGPVTHLLLAGDLTTAQARAFANNIPGSTVRPEVTGRRLLNLIRSLGLRKTTRPARQRRPHHMPLPFIHKVLDIAEAPFPVLAGSADDLHNVLPGIAVSDKWDGYTCSLKYDAGALVEGLTQDDSISGEDRTERLSTMVPATVGRPATMQIEGEVITATGIPRRAHYAMTQATDREFARYQCKFIAFDVRFAGRPFTTWSDAMAWLDAQGFDTVLNHVDDDYPKDGIVYRIDDYADWDLADPGTFALKFKET